MARYTGPKHRIARKEGINIFDKDSASLKRRLNFKPGQHGRKPSRRRLSEYGQQLREKQKAKAVYGLLEKQFKNLIKAVGKIKGDTKETLMSLLETRLDNMVFRLGFAKTRTMARQMVSHGHILVDGKKMNIPSYPVQIGQIVSLDSDMQKNIGVMELLKNTEIQVPAFLKKEGISGKLTRMPKAGDLVFPFDLQLIIEYYSR